MLSVVVCLFAFEIVAVGCVLSSLFAVCCCLLLLRGAVVVLLVVCC